MYNRLAKGPDRLSPPDQQDLESKHCIYWCEIARHPGKLTFATNQDCPMRLQLKYDAGWNNQANKYCKGTSVDWADDVTKTWILK